jgi:hypothetical protein
MKKFEQSIEYKNAKDPIKIAALAWAEWQKKHGS